MYSRPTKDELGKKLKILAKRKEVFERNPTIISWKKFGRLFYSDKKRIQREWDEYYEKVRASYSAEIYSRQYYAMINGDFATVKELADTARLLREQRGIDREMPTTIDPSEYNHGDIVKTYKEICREFDELQSYPSIQQSRVDMFED